MKLGFGHKKAEKNEQKGFRLLTVNELLKTNSPWPYRLLTIS